MHVLVPFASAASEACGHVLGDLTLPHLARVLSSFAEVDRDEAKELTFSPPHERALSRARGWRGADGALPFAAHAAEGDGIETGEAGWALLTPSHWLLGREGATLLDPDLIALTDLESRGLFASIDELFATEGLALAWGSAGRWYASNDGFDGLATASIDRVVGRSIGPWLAEAARREKAGRGGGIGALVGRLQSEAQLVFHSHAVNEEREELGRLTVNSFWLSGCGRHQSANDATALAIESALRTPLFAGDWVAWAEAWRALDAGPIARLLETARSGGAAALTLCGERAAVRFEPQKRPFWQRLRHAVSPADAARVLTSL